MGENFKEKSDQYWKTEAQVFDEHYKTDIFSLSFITKQFLDKRSKLISGLLETDAEKDLIDIGCGSGIHLKDFVDKFKRLIGVDYSQQMLDLSKHSLRDSFAKKVYLLNASANELCIKDASFESVLSLGLLDYLPDYKIGLTEFHRILKPHGKAIFTIPRKPSIFSFFRSGIGITLRKILFDLPPILAAVTKQELVTTLESMGFKILFLDDLWTTMWVVKVEKVH
jgi:ubiquinone/menaquinone biosynthesis C-methylase UbiE